jgi:hypothetical protein
MTVDSTINFVKEIPQKQTGTPEGIPAWTPAPIESEGLLIEVPGDPNRAPAVVPIRTGIGGDRDGPVERRTQDFLDA